jgi:hypothetical protein
MPAFGCHGILFSSEDWVCGARYARTKIAPPTHQISAPMLQTSSDSHFLCTITSLHLAVSALINAPQESLLGLNHLLSVVVVCHCYRGDDNVIRIISARNATTQELKAY